MSQPVVDLLLQPRIHWTCGCGFPLHAERHKSCGHQPAATLFFDARARLGRTPETCMDSCPLCGRQWPALAWQQFEDDHLAGGFGP